MATDDQQRLVTGVAAAPATFTIPGNGQMRPKAIFAHYDGSGAAGSFKPALKVTADGGKLVGIYPADSTIVAGGSADMSWFPGVSAAAASLSSPGLMAATVAIQGDFTVTTGDPGTLIDWTQAIFDLGTPTPFWDAAHPRRLNAPVSGVYLSTINPIWAPYGTNTPGQLATYLYRNTEVVTIAGSFQKVNSAPVASDAFNFPGQAHSIFELVAGDYLVVNAYCNTGTGPAFGTIDLLDLRTHVGQPPLYTAWSLSLLAAT